MELSIIITGVLVLILLAAALGIFIHLTMKYGQAQLRESLLKETLNVLQQSQQHQREDLISTSKLISENIVGRMDEIKKHQKETSEATKKHGQETFGHLSKNLQDNISKLTQTVHKQLGETIEKLGEFKELSKGVDSLTKVLSNVKQKGKFGEYQLESIIVDLVPNAYYKKEYSLRTDNHSGMKVDFVIQLPGEKQDDPPYLPIDSKYPHEPYGRLLEYRKNQDQEGEKAALKELFKFFKESAKDIKKKYIVPPETTDFAILFIPHESIFLEIYQDNDFVDRLRIDYNVMVTGPNHFYALLHMLQMGYTKLAIEKRSQLLWTELTTWQDGMLQLTESLTKAGRKAITLGDDIQTVYKRADKLTKSLNQLQNPSELLTEGKKLLSSTETANEEEVLPITESDSHSTPQSTPQLDSASTSKGTDEIFPSQDEILESYQKPLEESKETPSSSLF